MIELTTGNLTAGFRLFHQPLPLDDYWLLLLIPLVVAISVVYKTIKLDDLSDLVKETLILIAQIVGFMVLVTLALWLLTEMI